MDKNNQSILALFTDHYNKESIQKAEDFVYFIQQASNAISIVESVSRQENVGSFFKGKFKNNFLKLFNDLISVLLTLYQFKVVYFFFKQLYFLVNHGLEVRRFICDQTAYNLYREYQM